MFERLKSGGKYIEPSKLYALHLVVRMSAGRRCFGVAVVVVRRWLDAGCWVILVIKDGASPPAKPRVFWHKGEDLVLSCHPLKIV